MGLGTRLTAALPCSRSSSVRVCARVRNYSKISIFTFIDSLMPSGSRKGREQFRLRPSKNVQQGMF